MCELCLDSREGDACRRPEHVSVPAAGGGEAFKRTKTKAPHFGPRGGGEEEAKPSRLRLAEPAHARALAIRTRSWRPRVGAVDAGASVVVLAASSLILSAFRGCQALGVFSSVFSRRHGFKPIGPRRGSKTLGAAEIRRETRTLESPRLLRWRLSKKCGTL